MLKKNLKEIYPKNKLSKFPEKLEIYASKNKKYINEPKSLNMRKSI